MDCVAQALPHIVRTVFGLRDCRAGTVAGLCALLLMHLGVPARAQVRWLTNEWSVPITRGGDASLTIGADGTIYFGTWDGRLLAVKPGGPIKWSFHADREIRTVPGLADDGTIYFGSRDRRLYALQPDGGLKWRFMTGGWIDSSPAIAADGTVYFGSWDKNLYALEPNGRKKWVFPTEGEIVSSPAIGDGGVLFFGSHDRRFYALGPDGTKRWTHTTGGPIISSPAIDRDGTLYFSSADGLFYALRPDGTLKWRLRTGGVTGSSPVIGEQGLIYVGVNDRLWVISPEGSKRFVVAFAEGRVEASPLALADGSVCFLSNYGYLGNYGPENKFNWEFRTIQGTFTPSVDSVGRILTATHSDVPPEDYVSALKADVPLAHSSWPCFRGNPRNTGIRNNSGAAVQTAGTLSK